MRMLGVEGLFRPAAGRYQAVMPGSTPNDSEQAILRMILADVGAMERPLTRWLTEMEAIDPLIFHPLGCRACIRRELRASAGIYDIGAECR